MPRLALTAVALLGALILPAAADAGTITAVTTVNEGGDRAPDITQTALRYAAGPGEANDVTIVQRDRDYVVRDPAGLRAGEGCAATADPAEAVCPGGDPGVVSIEAELGDGDDRLVTPKVFAERVDGGPGDDRIEAPAVNLGDGPRIFGGEGADILRSANGVLDGGPGPDDMAAAAVSYAGRAEPIAADLDGLPDDGAAGEGDRIDSVVRRLIGGDADDRLEGADGWDTITGGPGADRIAGGHGDDALSGGPGADDLDGAGGDDQLSAAAEGEPPGPAERLAGGPGDDVLLGSAGPDVLDGGAGHDSLDGNGGDDDVRMVDGEPDLVTCAFPPAPRAGAAALDRRDLARGCARVSRTRPGVPQILIFGLSEWDRDGTVRAGVGCSQDQRGGCRVRMRLRRGGRTLAEGRRRIPAGTARLVRARIRAKLFGPCRTVPVTAEIHLRDMAGRRRTIRRRIEIYSTALACSRGSLEEAGPGW